MAQRPIELPWLRQPTEQAGIDWSNPLTRSLVRLVAWRGIEAVDLVTGAALNRVSTGFAAAVLSDGEGSSNTNESSYWELPITTEARNSLSMGWVGLHSGGSVPITVRDSSSSFGTILFWRSGGGWQTRAGGTGGSADIAAAGAFAIGRIYAACTSIGASTARVHVDGAQVTSGSTSGSSGILLSPWVLHHNGAISGAALASSLLLAVWDRDLTATEAQSFTGRPWQLFKDQIIWVPVSATADVTVALSGSSVAANAGALTPSTSVAVSGSVSAASTGTLAPTASLALTGSSVTASSGTLTPSLSVTLSGQSVTSSAGTLTANTGSDVTVALSGAAVTVSAGTIAPSATVALSGSAVTSAVGAVSPGLSVALSGASSTSAAGTLTASTSQDVTVALTGSAVTVSAGTLTPSGGDTPAVNPGWGGGAVGGGGGKGLRELTARIAKDAEDLLERKRKAPNAQISQPAALEPAPAPTRKTSSRSAGSSESADRVAAEPAVPGSQAEVLFELRSLRGAVEKLEALILADREEARKRQEQDEEEAAVVKLLLN